MTTLSLEKDEAAIVFGPDKVSLSLPKMNDDDTALGHMTLATAIVVLITKDDSFASYVMESFDKAIANLEDA